MTVDIVWLSTQFPFLNNLEHLRPGGQKWVFKCGHQDYGACVLKLVIPGADSRHERELEAVRRLAEVTSRFVPEILDYGTIQSHMGELVWILERYVDGIDLDEKIAQGPLDSTEAIRLGLDLLTTARDGESVKTVHRDIKPRNIKIDSEGNAWLLDYGIARIIDMESVTPTNQPVGPHSPGYSAPEQFSYRKRQIDGRSDLFAIGVVLYECTTGGNPFIAGASDRDEILRRVENETLPNVELSWDRDSMFIDFIQSATQKYPYLRPRSCTAALRWFKDIADILRS